MHQTSKLLIFASYIKVTEQLFMRLTNIFQQTNNPKILNHVQTITEEEIL